MRTTAAMMMSFTLRHRPKMRYVPPALLSSLTGSFGCSTWIIFSIIVLPTFE